MAQTIAASGAHPREEGRFVSGTVFGGRYRIIALIGRGGMGEVYRATDLKLGQAVALKFLPEVVASDPAMLARFYHEVRVARDVTHPNVCRVYDLGEMGGLHFISMEYIDGEDLASLLRRIGRVPPDKGLEIARRLCVGLAAAHKKGILHRDLKPANVMIDGRGQVRITDFGLAGLTGEFHASDIRSGTPLYMAPEQLAGKEVSIRSDIYSLGLVLYEVFTGRPAFAAAPVAELAKRKQPPPVPPSHAAPEIDPAIDAAILCCLASDPRNRPASAAALGAALAAALPGHNTLAAVIAAGETPAPEMLADSQAAGGLSVSAALACFAAALIGIAAVVVLSAKTNLVLRTGLEKSPEVLAMEARDRARRLGYRDSSADRAYGFAYANDGLRYLEHHKTWNAARPSAIVFWYRESPGMLLPSAFSIPAGLITRTDPPPLMSGMIGVTLDARGNLLSFYAVPPQVQRTQEARDPSDQEALFAAAGLDPSIFKPAVPEWTPPAASDARLAWQDETPNPIRLEAAYWRGRPVYFELTGPWSLPGRMQAREVSLPERFALTISLWLFIGVLILGALLARYNVRRNRSDLRGANRLASAVFTLQMLVWLCGARHVLAFWEARLIVLGLSWAAYSAGLIWMLYLALEPFVRRRWPQVLISWTRILAGRIRDPLVGAHLLIGVATGTAIALLFQGGMLWNSGVRLSTSIGVPSTAVLLGGRHILRELFFYAGDAVNRCLTLLFIMFALRLILRNEILAAATSVVIVTAVVAGSGSGHFAIVAGAVAACMAVSVVVLARFGLVALTAGVFADTILGQFPVTTDLSSWYFEIGLTGIAVVVALAAFGLYAAVTGKTHWKHILLDG